MGKLANLALDSLPTFKCLVPSTGKTVTLRSFVVKEQKLLLIAKQSSGDDQLTNIVNAVTQLIQNCVVKGDLDVSELPSFDIEYIFVQLYTHSMGQTKSKVFYQCLNPVLDEAGNITKDEEGEPVVCGQTNGVVVDLSTAKVQTSEISNGVIDVKSNSIDKLVLKYPNFEQMTRHDTAVADENIDETFKVYAECLRFVYKADGTQLIAGEDFELEDAIEMMELLQDEIFKKVTGFYLNTPSISATTGFKCRKCGHETNIELRGLQDFF